MSEPSSVPSPERWADVKRLFEAVVDLEPAARHEYLRASTDHPEVVAEVRALLDWDQEGDRFLDRPAFHGAAFDDRLRVGQRIGAWRIVDVIGRGGMGVVYRAERADDAFVRQVALKVIRHGADAASVVDRFRRERETLARLDHRNIARLLDGGSTDDGEPYFVMEFVDGVPIDRYCDERRLTIPERLELFSRVCAGVQYAHANLVVHRDIKPDNILVTADGTPKLLDFGVAKLLTDDRSTGTELAATWLMTPDFASPEQLGGAASATSTDVYSLGVVLYVLLTGLRPYRLTGQSPADIRAELAAVQITRPSQVVKIGANAADRAARRGLTPSRLVARLAGDLNAVVLRALSHDPGSRYATVDPLVRDLRAYLADEPVSARPSTWPYRLSKFATRHSVALWVTFVASVLAMSSVWAIGTQASIASQERAKAQRRFNDVRRLATGFLFDVNDRIANVPGTMETQEMIVRNMVEYLGILERESAGDPGLQLDLALAWVRVGDVQGNPAGANLGDVAGATQSYRNAVRLAEGVRSLAPDALEATRALALAHRRLGDVLAWSGRVDDALDEQQESSALYSRVVAASPTTDDRLEEAVAEVKLGDVLGSPDLPNLGRTADARARFDRALDLLRALDADARGDIRVRRFLGLTLERIGALHEEREEWAPAATAYQASFDIRRDLAARQPTHRDIQRDLGIAFEKLGKVQEATGAPGAGLANLRGALRQFEALAAADPADANAARTVAVSEEVLATALTGASQSAEAKTRLIHAIDIHEELARRDPGNAQARCDAARVSERLGDLFARGPSAQASGACDRWRAASWWLESRGEPDGGCTGDAETRTRLRARLQSCGEDSR